MQCFHARNAAGTAKYTHENRFFPKFPQIQVQRSSSKVTAKRRGRVSLSCCCHQVGGKGVVSSVVLRACGLFAQMTVVDAELDRIHFHTGALSCWRKPVALY